MPGIGQFDLKAGEFLTGGREEPGRFWNFRGSRTFSLASTTCANGMAKALKAALFAVCAAPAKSCRASFCSDWRMAGPAPLDFDESLRPTFYYALTLRDQRHSLSNLGAEYV